MARHKKASTIPRGGWRHLPAALMALVFLLPLFFMITGSLRRRSCS